MYHSGTQAPSSTIISSARLYSEMRSSGSCCVRARSRMVSSSRVGVRAVVERAIGVEQNVQEVLRIGIVRLPAQTGVGLELGIVEVFEISRPFHLLDFDFHAQDLAPHLDHDLEIQPNRAAGAGHGNDDPRP